MHGLVLCVESVDQHVVLFVCMGVVVVIFFHQHLVIDQHIVKSVCVVSMVVIIFHQHLVIDQHVVKSV